MGVLIMGVLIMGVLIMGVLPDIVGGGCTYTYHQYLRTKKINDTIQWLDAMRFLFI